MQFMKKYIVSRHTLILLVISLVFVSLIVGACSSQDVSTNQSPVGTQTDQSNATPCLTTREAMNSVGKTACVEFFVGNPSQFKGEVFLNEMADYTKGFQAVILANSLGNFNDPVSQYRSKTIRVSGLIIEYDGHPGIIVSVPSDITVVR
jgi:hypothetical protein